MRISQRALIPLFLAPLAAACAGDGPAAATAPPAELRSFTVTPEAHAAARLASRRLIRSLPIIARRSGPSGDRVGVSAALVRSPLDLSNHGGLVVGAAKSWNVYVNCSDGPGCWGSDAVGPAEFLADLAGSRMIHLADQYLYPSRTGYFAETRRAPFTVGEMTTTAAFAANTATMDDVLGIVYAAYQRNVSAGGYTNIYHVFLPQGIDMCQADSICYSPDNWNTFYFCAFHGSVDFGAGAHVLFSVEPYQYVPGCTAHPELPVFDATANTLSHEFFETISDPDLDAWWNDLTQFEMGDLCQAFESAEHLGAHSYLLQLEYSNRVHGCVDAP